MATEFKKTFNSEMNSIEKQEKQERKVRVKFNFSLAQPKFDSSIAMKKAKEEKSYIAFELQNHIDLMTYDNFYAAGNIYDVSEEFYDKFVGRTVETYNPLFGNFQGKSKKLVERPKVPYMLKVDSEGNLLDPMQHKLDLYAKDE